MAPEEAARIKESLEACVASVKRIDSKISNMKDDVKYINKKLSGITPSGIAIFSSGIYGILYLATYIALAFAWLFSFALPGVDWMKWFPFYAWYVVIKHFATIHGWL